MRLLLDTHALLWWVAGSERLSATARGAIADDANDVLVSAASAWEIATKYRLGRLPGAAAVAEDVTGCLLDQGFQPLAITVGDGERAGRLPGPVRDPFDRMLIAQALTLDIALVSVEQPFDRWVTKSWNTGTPR